MLPEIKRVVSRAAFLGAVCLTLAGSVLGCAPAVNATVEKTPQYKLVNNCVAPMNTLEFLDQISGLENSVRHSIVLHDGRTLNLVDLSHEVQVGPDFANVIDVIEEIDYTKLVRSSGNIENYRKEPLRDGSEVILNSGEPSKLLGECYPQAYGLTVSAQANQPGIDISEVALPRLFEYAGRQKDHVTLTWATFTEIVQQMNQSGGDTSFTESFANGEGLAVAFLEGNLASQKSIVQLYELYVDQATPQVYGTMQYAILNFDQFKALHDAFSQQLFIWQ